MTKLEALANFLECETDEIEQTKYDDNTFSCGRAEYLVLTDAEATTKAEEAIMDSLWAFNAEFIASHTERGLTNRAIDAFKKMQEELCEDANDIVLAMIKDAQRFCDDAIAADGRGHFLSSYDGEENESGEFFIYRTN